MDKETKREIWLLAIGAALIEAPVVAIVALMVLTH
jgi:Tfp pilus assembly protein PilN